MASLARLWLALLIAFDRPRAYALAIIAALAMLLILIWNSGGLNYYPASGWAFYAPATEIAAMLALSGLFGLLVPLQVAALGKARAASTATGGLVGSVFAIAGVSCCAPLLLPALLSFVGFSGTALLGFNLALRDWSPVLTVASIMLMLTSIGLVARTITTECTLPRRSLQSG
jgi:hypothetical protein